MCTDRLAAQSDSSPEATRPQDRIGVPDDLASANVFDLGANEPAAPIFQGVLGYLDAFVDGAGIADEVTGDRRGG